jgi:hypothetical protein
MKECREERESERKEKMKGARKGRRKRGILRSASDEVRHCDRQDMIIKHSSRDISTKYAYYNEQ